MPRSSRLRLVVAALVAVASTGCVAPDLENVPVPPSTTVAATTTTTADAPTVDPVTGSTTATTDPVTGELLVPEGASRVVTLPPTRLYDSGQPPPNCTGSQAPETVTPVPVTGVGGTPSEGLTGVLVNVVVSDAAGPGEVTVWSTDAERPAAPTVRLSGPCDGVVKLTLVPIGVAGSLQVSSTVAARVAVDVVGALVAAPRGARGGRVVPVNPRRVLDTANSLGATGPLAPDAQVELTLAGQSSVPVGAAAVLLQLTATDGKPPGIVTAWAAGAGTVDAPDLLVPPAGSAAGNLVLAPLSTTGKVALRVTSSVNLTADLVGWVTGDGSAEVTTGLVLATPPGRVIDTADAPLEPYFRRDATLADPPSGAGAVLVQTTSTAPAAAGSVTVYPTGTPVPGVPTAPLLAGGLPSTSPALVRLGQGNALSVSADASTGLAVDRLAWIFGVPVPPDPTVPPIPPDVTGSPANPEFDRVVDGFLANRGLAGASVAVAKDGRIVYVRAYGRMDGDGTPVRVDTRFRFASISKVITAAAVLQLVQAGALRLDDSVVGLLADRLPLGDNPDPRLGRVSVRDLLRHTSGFTQATDPFFPEQPRVRQVFGPSGPKSCQEAARWFMTLPLVAEPGSRFAYVNMNYCLLSLLVERFTGETYDKVVQSLVLERRNVRDARIGASFGRKPDEVAYPAANGTFLESLSGAGGWLGTAVDLARFIDGLDPDKPGQHLLKPSTYQQLVSPYLGSWGLGVEVFEDGSWGHTGSLASARAMALHQPDGITWGIVVNGNIENHNEVLRDVMVRALATSPEWPTWDYSPELP